MRQLLLTWYYSVARDLPWRRTTDPWRILISEVMLQQTRVATVIPYYERFVQRFPAPAAMAASAESEVLALWSGLGYYSRARNLQKAARVLAESGEFPKTWEGLRALPGVGEYTAAAVGSIAFRQPFAVLDGNVLRVLSRVTGERKDIGTTATRRRLGEAAQSLLDPGAPGDFNQALMELGATLCAPRNPDCRACPWGKTCRARLLGLENKLPKLAIRPKPERVELHLLLIVKHHRVLLYRRPADGGRLAGFWDLPAAGQIPQARVGTTEGTFRHSITNRLYFVTVSRARVESAPPGMRWLDLEECSGLPLTTITKKAFRLAKLGIKQVK